MPIAKPADLISVSFLLAGPYARAHVHWNEENIRHAQMHRAAGNLRAQKVVRRQVIRSEVLGSRQLLSKPRLKKLFKLIESLSVTSLRFAKKYCIPFRTKHFYGS
jgi:hypothetical protein